MLSLEFTPESKRILDSWGTDKAKKLKIIREEWVDKMEAFMLGSAERSFVLQKQMGGDPWPVNSDGWKIRKMELGARTTKTNIFTGAMQRSLSSSKDGFSARVGLPVDYAVKTIPHRQVMPADKYTIDYGQKLFEGLLRKMS